MQSNTGNISDQVRFSLTLMYVYVNLFMQVAFARLVDGIMLEIQAGYA
jgi:hypothetical protein